MKDQSRNTTGGAVLLPREDLTPDFSRYRAQWETALLVQRISADLDDHARKRVLQSWVQAMFNAAAFGVSEALEESGSLDWIPASPTQWDLMYTAPYGLTCSLARAYQQAEGVWASLVIAGVKDDLQEAMVAAEWAIARLSH